MMMDMFFEQVMLLDQGVSVKNVMFEKQETE